MSSRSCISQKRALGTRCLGRLGSKLGIGVHIVQGQVPPDVADIAEVTQKLAHDPFRPAAVRTLKVAVLNDR